MTDRVLTDGYFASIARGLGVPEYLLDDALQEIRLRLWRAEQKSGQSPAPFASVLAKRATIDFLRKHCRRRGRQAAEVRTFSDLAAITSLEESSSEDDMGHLGIVSPQDLDVHLELTDVYAAVRKLPPREREIVRQYCLFGFPFWRIGENMGISESRVQQLLRRALAGIRRETGETLGSV